LNVILTAKKDKIRNMALNKTRVLVISFDRKLVQIHQEVVFMEKPFVGFDFHIIKNVMVKLLTAVMDRVPNMVPTNNGHNNCNVYADNLD